MDAIGYLEVIRPRIQDNPYEPRFQASLTIEILDLVATEDNLNTGSMGTGLTTRAILVQG